MPSIAAEPVRAPLDLLAEIALGLADAESPRSLLQDAMPTGRVGVRVLDSGAYDAWVVWWPPGSRVEPHDHGVSHGVFVIAMGELTEIRWVNDDRAVRRLQQGEVCLLPSGVVHDVVATGPTPAVSVHVYSPPLTEMGFYDNEGTTLIEVQATDTDTTFDARFVSRALHPSNA